MASTVIVPFVTVVSAGTSTSSRAVAGLLFVAFTPVTTKPPPWRVAFQPVGTPLTERSTVPELGTAIVRSKLALEPGATAIDGYGVVTDSESAAATAGTRPTRKTAAVARAITGRRARVIRDVGKGPLRQSV